MNSPILDELNIIRIREQRKLLYMIQEQLNATALDEQSQVPELTRQLIKLNKENQHDTNYHTAVANYKKLSSILLLLARKNKKISPMLLALKNFKPRQKFLIKPIIKSFLIKIIESKSSKDSDKPPLSEFDKIIQRITDDLGEINQKIKSLLPEQLNLKPLGPFNFLNKNAELTEGMVSIMVLNENGADHLKNLFDSFLKHNTYNNFRFFILDRCSSDDSHDIIRSYHNKIPMEIIDFDQRFTNSYLYNLAVDSCRSEYLLFLNNKVIVKDDFIPVYLDLFSKNKSCGIIGASVFQPVPGGKGGTTGRYGSIRFAIDDVSGQPDIPYPIIDTSFLLQSGIETSFKEYRNKEGVYIPPGTSLICLKPVFDNTAEKADAEIVPAVLGSALMCRKNDFIKAGGFDLNYYNGYEDIDLCLKFITSLGKSSLLSTKTELQSNAINIQTELGLADEFNSNYNLGTLLNKHGYILKNKYLESILKKEHFWTSDNLESLAGNKSLASSLKTEPADDTTGEGNLVLNKKIITNYLEGFKNKRLRIAIKIPALNDGRAQFWGDYHFAHALKNAFISKGHPARVDLFESWYDSGFLTDDVVIILRGVKKYQPRGSQINIIWNISHPERIDESEYRDYDHVFVASHSFALELKEKAGINAEVLLQCTDPGSFYPDATLISDEVKTDILYVANSRGIMRKSVEFAIKKNIPVTIYGTGWEKLLPAEMIKGNFIKNEELRKYYSSCNILLNDHWKDMTESGFISNRIFDALACGAIVLTDPVRGIDQLFNEGIYFYRNADEFAGQIKWIKENLDEAKRLALKNQEIILGNHTFTHRADRILEVVKQIHHLKT